MKTVQSTLIVLLALTFSMALQAKKIELKYVLEKGSEFVYELSTTQEITQEVMGQSQGTEASHTQVIKFTVLDITKDGNYLIKRMITSMKIKVSSPMGDIEYNSDDEDSDNIFASTLGWLLSTPIEFIMSPSGEILEIMEADKLADGFADIFSGGGAESQMVMGLGSQFSSEEGIKQTIGAMLIIFPEAKVKVGKAWESQSEIQQIINLKSSISTMINEVNDDTAMLSQDVKISVGDGENVMEVQGMEMEYDLSGEKKAALELDLVTGLLLKSEGVTTISGLISIDSPQLPAPMSIPMTIKTTEKVTRK